MFHPEWPAVAPGSLCAGRPADHTLRGAAWSCSCPGASSAAGHGEVSAHTGGAQWPANPLTAWRGHPPSHHSPDPPARRLPPCPGPVGTVVSSALVIPILTLAAGSSAACGPCIGTALGTKDSGVRDAQTTCSAHRGASCTTSAPPVPAHPITRGRWAHPGPCVQCWPEAPLRLEGPPSPSWCSTPGSARRRAAPLLPRPGDPHQPGRPQPLLPIRHLRWAKAEAHARRREQKSRSLPPAAQHPPRLPPFLKRLSPPSEGEPPLKPFSSVSSHEGMWGGVPTDAPGASIPHQSVCPAARATTALRGCRVPGTATGWDPPDTPPYCSVPFPSTRTRRPPFMGLFLWHRVRPCDGVLWFFALQFCYVCTEQDFTYPAQILTLNFFSSHKLNKPEKPITTQLIKNRWVSNCWALN